MFDFFLVTDDGYLETETTQLNILNSTTVTVDMTISLTEKPLQNSELNTKYLLVGVGIIISIILFIILIHLCKNSQSSNKPPTPTQQKSNDNETVGDTSHRSHSGQGKDYKTISSSRDSSHLYRHMKLMNVWS